MKKATISSEHHTKGTVKLIVEIPGLGRTHEVFNADEVTDEVMEEARARLSEDIVRVITAHSQTRNLREEEPKPLPEHLKAVV